MRALQRVYGVSRATLANWIKKSTVYLRWLRPFSRLWRTMY